jgi:hypothetical protein
MSAPPLVLATASELRAIFQRAFAAIDAVFARDDDDDRDQRRRDKEQIEAAVEALRFCAVAAGHLGEPALLPFIAQAIDVCDRFDDHAEDHRTMLGHGLTRLLDRGAPVDADVRELAIHDDARIRAAVARGLRPRGDAEIALLEALSIDAIAEVRNAANKTLSTVRDVPWWAGKFASDPLARLSEAEALRHKPAFERISAMLDQPRYALVKSEGELVEHVASLPDLLAVELAEKVLSGTDPYRTRFIALGTMMLARPGGVDALARLCALWNDDNGYVDGKETAKMLMPLADDARVAACMQLATLAVGLPEKARTSQTGSAGRLLGETAGHAFPAGADLTPLLDLMLGLPPVEEEYAIDWVAYGLGEAFDADGADPTPILDRALAARLAGYPGAWKRLGRHIDTLLARAPASAVRPFAERALESDDDGSIKWALEQLLGPTHDETRDPPKTELVARFLGDPRYRKAVIETAALSQLAIPLLRAELRAGTLDFATAVTTMNLIGEVYGGVVAPSMRPVGRSRSDASEKAESQRRARREELEAFLGPPDLRGPPTDEEWTQLRELRALRAAVPGEELDCLFGALPSGPWSPEDRAFLDQAIARFDLQDGGALIRLGMVLASKPTLDTYPLFGALLARAPRESHKLVRLSHQDAADALGLPFGEAAEEHAAEVKDEAGDEGDGDDDNDTEWMDEPDA